MIERITSKEEFDVLRGQYEALLFDNPHRSRLIEVVEGGMAAVSPVADDIVSHLINEENATEAELFGSTVRNYFLKREHGIDITEGDIDIGIDYHTLPNSGRLTHCYDNRPIEKLIESLKSHPRIEDVEESFINTYSSVDHRFSALYDDNGVLRKIDFCIFSGQTNNDLIRTGDAPINSVSINEKGEVYAHPFFEEHVRDLSYAALTVSPERAKERVKDLQAEIPEIRDIGSFHDLPEVKEASERRLSRRNELKVRIELAEAEEYGNVPKHPSQAFAQAVNDGDVDILKVLDAIQYQRKQGSHISGATHDFEEFFTPPPVVRGFRAFFTKAPQTPRRAKYYDRLP